MPPSIHAAESIAPEVLERAGRVGLIVLDVDGVMTDGRLHLDQDGLEWRSFHVRDGLGIRLGQRAGLRFAIISGRQSPVVAARAAELDIVELHQGIRDKRACLASLLERCQVRARATCFAGDDLIDVPAMREVGFAVAPADAVPEAREVAHYVTRAAGGLGAVRELIELVLRAGGHWDDVMRQLTE